MKIQVFGKPLIENVSMMLDESASVMTIMVNLTEKWLEYVPYLNANAALMLGNLAEFDRNLFFAKYYLRVTIENSCILLIDQEDQDDPVWADICREVYHQQEKDQIIFMCRKYNPNDKVIARFSARK